jgi:peptidoglycan-binding protein ArfA
VLALIAIPLLLGWMGWSGLHRSDAGANPTAPAMTAPAMTGPAMTGPAMTGPAMTGPEAAFAPLTVKRVDSGFTLTGDLPDEEMKTGLLSALRSAFGSNITLTDNLTIKPGVKGPEFAGLGAVFGTSAGIPDFGFDVSGNTVTLTGTAPSADVKSDVEEAAKSAWPNIVVVNNIQVRSTAPPAAPSAATPTQTPTPSPQGAPPGGPCANLQADVNALLRTPVSFTTDGFSLASSSRQLLGEIADKLTACPNARAAVVGHTDNAGSDAINIPLSGNRAKSVADYLITEGVARDHVTSSGVGSADPIADNNTAAGRAQNRRVDITVS